MKRNTFIYVGILLIFTGFMVFQSCAQSINNEGSSFNPVEKALNNGNSDKKGGDDNPRFARQKRMYTWQDYLDAIVLGKNTYMNNQGLKLIECHIDDNINIDSFVTMGVSKKDFFPKYRSNTINTNRKKNEFKILKLSNFENYRKSYSRYKKKLVKDFKGDSLLVINLIWDYKGKRIKTNCIVTCNPKRVRKIVYGVLLSNIHYTTYHSKGDSSYIF